MSLLFKHGYYIKLGRGGVWEADAIQSGKLRLGWRGQSLADILAGRWDDIHEQLKMESVGKPQVATTDFNRLRDLVHSDSSDVWITFHGGKLWWARLADMPMQEDAISKYRVVEGAWSDCSLLGHRLRINELPGKLAQLQGFRGTVCRVQEAELLGRVLEGRRSELAVSIDSHRGALCMDLRRAIETLHWKDFETLVDLVFRHAGWKRESILGEQVKGYDLALREPITGDRVVVQVKSQASRADMNKTVTQFSSETYRKVFFVVHSPSSDLQVPMDLPSHVELVDPQHLAELAMDAGLVAWLADKVV